MLHPRGKNRTKVILELSQGEIGSAMEILGRSQSKSGSVDRTIDRRQFSSYTPDASSHLKNEIKPILVKASTKYDEPSYVRVKIQNEPDRDPSPKKVESWKKEVSDLVKHCKHSGIYSVLLELPSVGSLPIDLVPELASLKDQAIEYAFYAPGDDIKKVASEIALTDVMYGAPYSMFKAKERANLYPKNIYVVEVEIDLSKEILTTPIQSLFKAELGRVLVELKDKNVLFLIHADEVDIDVLNYINSTSRKFLANVAFHFTDCKDEKILGYTSKGNLYSLELEELKQKAVSPHIMVPENGWTCINAPRYLKLSEVFLVSGFQNLNSMQRSEFQADLKALAKSGDKKFLIDVAGTRLTTDNLLDLKQHLHVHCETKGGVVVINADNLNGQGSLIRSAGLNVVSTFERAYEELTRHYPVRGPQGGFDVLKYPKKYSADKSVLCTELRERALRADRIVVAMKDIFDEFRMIAHTDVTGVIIDVKSAHLDDDFIERMETIAQGAYTTEFAVVVQGSEYVTRLNNGTLGADTLFFKSVDEAFLQIAHRVIAPPCGWQMFRLRPSEYEDFSVIAEMGRGDLTTDLIYKAPPIEFENEVKQLATCISNLVLDLRSISMVSSESLTRALLSAQSIMRTGRGTFTLVTRAGDAQMFRDRGVRNVMTDI